MFANLHHGLVTVAMHHIVRNDTAHRTDHIMQVAQNCLDIAKRYDLDTTTMLLAALLHDIYSGRDRVNHHLLAAEWVRTNLHKYGYSEEVVANVAIMCEEHRDSGDGVYSNRLSEAFAAADRGPMEIVSSVERGFGRTIGNITDEELDAAWPKTIKMLRAKFGEGGYSCFNAIHLEVYRLQTTSFVQMLKRMDDDALLLHVKNSRKYLRFTWPHRDEVAHNDFYVIHPERLTVFYDPNTESFMYLTGKLQPAHEVSVVHGMLQVNPAFYQGESK